jgi:hypothetical protein
MRERWASGDAGSRWWGGAQFDLKHVETVSLLDRLNPAHHHAKL